jgi:hypothetical protein
MEELPAARVVRDGGPREEGGGEAPRNLLRLAPRAVPRHLVWRLWFGSLLGVFGWLFAAFGMVFVLIFLPMAEVLTPDYDRIATAEITRVEETSSTENDARIYAVHYAFVDERGVTRRGVSYTKDASVGGSREVHYVAGDPDQSRLAGMRSQRFGAFVIFVVIFPIVGLSIAGWQLWTGRNAVHLLRFGVETRGKLIDKKKTNTRVNGRPVMALTFEYELDGQPFRAVVKTLNTASLEDDALEPMLYDPHRPSRATTLDHLPGTPSVGPDGELRVRPGMAAHVLILPILTLGLLVATVALLFT